MPWIDIAQYGAVLLIGAFVGIGELLSRYKDEPFLAVANRHAIVYTALNAAASVVALVALKSLHLNLGPVSTDGTNPVSQIDEVLLGGFGSMAVFRSSTFVVRVSNQDVAIGPNALLTVLLAATDRAVDRYRAKVRATQVATTMKSISFAQCSEALPTLAFFLMQNVTAEDKATFQKEVDQLKQMNIDDATKSMCLGLSLINVVGPGVLEAAVEAMHKAAVTGGDPAAISARTGQPVPPVANTLQAAAQPQPPPK